MKIQNVVLSLLLLACGPKSHPKEDAAVSRDAVTPDSVIVDATTVDVAVIDAQEADAPDNKTGSVNLAIRTDGRDKNCAPDGALINTMTVKVIDSSNQCLPSRIIHRRVGTLLEEYDTTCPTPPAKACFEVSDELLVSHLAPGGYHIVVTGLVQGTTCWLGDASVGVVEDRSTAQGLTLIKQNTCD